jgi:hypothetical protein
VNTEKNEGPDRVADHIVTCIDVLGQREKLKNFPRLIHGGVQPELLVTALKDTYGRVNRVRQLLETYFAAGNPAPERYPWFSTLSEEQRRDFKRLASYTMNVRHFSDMIVSFSLLCNEDDQPSLAPVVQMLGSCAMSMLFSLAEGIAVRGGVDIGAAAVWPDFGIYGSAYYSAYDLESRVAKYPRIIVGEELFKYLQSWQQTTDEDPLSKYNSQLATTCFTMIREDLDGRQIVDFLNRKTWAAFGVTEEERLQALLQERDRGFKFILQEHDRFRKGPERDSELAFRYALLASYYAAASSNSDQESPPIPDSQARRDS